MFEVFIFCVGRPKWSPIETMLEEYAKRLTHDCQIIWKYAKDERQLSEWVSQAGPYIALVIEGKRVSSLELKNLLIDTLILKKKVSFVIGPDIGLSKEMQMGAFFQLSLSPLTFTHEITRLILAEQIYRAFQIHKNTPYHK